MLQGGDRRGRRERISVGAGPARGSSEYRDLKRVVKDNLPVNLAHRLFSLAAVVGLNTKGEPVKISPGA